jgi:2-dehydropantoate 2-reductase
VARSEGINLSNRRAVAALERVIDATADNRSSTLQDVAAGRRTEVEAIVGEVVARAERASREGHVAVSVPTLRTLADLLRAWESGRGVREA